MDTRFWQMLVFGQTAEMIRTTSRCFPIYDGDTVENARFLIDKAGFLFKILAKNQKKHLTILQKVFIIE